MNQLDSTTPTSTIVGNVEILSHNSVKVEYTAGALQVNVLNAVLRIPVVNLEVNSRIINQSITNIEPAAENLQPSSSVNASNVSDGNSQATAEQASFKTLPSTVELQRIALRRSILFENIKKFITAAADTTVSVNSNNDTEARINSVRINSISCLDEIQKNRDKFKFDNTHMEERDGTIKNNPKAFWFGVPETDEEKKEFLDNIIQSSFQNCPELTLDQRNQLHDLVFEFKDCLRTRLGNDKVADFPPMKVELKPDAKPKIMSAYSVKGSDRDQMQQAVNELENAGLNERIVTAKEYCSAVHMVPKPGGAPGEKRLVKDYRYVNSQLKTIQGPMTILSDEFETVNGSKYFFTGDFLKGFYQIALDEDSQEYYSFMTPWGVYKPTRVPQGAANSPVYMHNCLGIAFDSLRQLKAFIHWIDDVLVHAKDFDTFMIRLREFFQICRVRKLQCNVKKLNLAAHEVIFCGRVVSGTGIRLEARNSTTFKNMKEPTTAGDLGMFLYGINWMCESIPPIGPGKSTPINANFSYKAVARPLYDLLNSIHNRIGSNKKSKYEKVPLINDWTEEHEESFRRIQQQLQHTVEHAFLHPESRVFLFSDASPLFYACMVTQVFNWIEGKEIWEQEHQIVACLSGQFKGSELRWRMIEKEAYPVIVALEQWHYLLHARGFHIYNDHDNLVKIFHPEKITPPLAQSAIHRVYNWLYVLANFQILGFEYINTNFNSWMDAFSRWANPEYMSQLEQSSIKTFKSKKRKISNDRKKSLVQEQLYLLFMHDGPRCEIPSDEVIIESQKEQYLSKEVQDWKIKNKDSFLSLDNGMLMFNGKKWIPHDNITLITRCWIGSHVSEGGHRSIEVTLGYLQEHVYWDTMNEDVKCHSNKCLLCLKLKPSSDRVPRPYGVMHLHDAEVGEALTFDWVYIGTYDHEFSWVLILKDVKSSFVELLNTGIPCSETAADAIKMWVARYGKPRYLMSDRGSHFLNQVVDELSKFYNCTHHFTLPYCPWAHGSIETVAKTMKPLYKITLKENKFHFKDFHRVTPNIMSIINQTPSTTLANYSPREVFLGKKAFNPFDNTLTEIACGNDNINLIQQPSNNNNIKQQLVKTVEALHKLQKDISQEVTLARAKVRAETVKHHENAFNVRRFRAKELGIPIALITPENCLPDFAVGDYVLVAIPKKPQHAKLTAFWRGPYRVVHATSRFTYEVEHLVTEVITEHHISRMIFYADSLLDLEIPQLHNQLLEEESLYNELFVEQFTDVMYDFNSGEYQLQAKWRGLSELENTWQSFSEFLEDIPNQVFDYINGLSDSHPHKKVLLQRTEDHIESVKADKLSKKQLNQKKKQ